MAEQIERYEIRRELGRGGMATVYLAYDPRFQRQVAIKVLPRQFTHDPKYLARFEQEARTIAALEHPAIVPVHDFGEHNDAPYLVMRYMAGGSLRQRLGDGPLTLAEITPVLDRLAPALDHAHELGIIHRDLKPSNILFDYGKRPYLADFGIARLAEASQTMTIIGTPAYMSPEQAESKVKLDGRSDIYALGVILYELLTGEQPYVAETPTGQMVMHILEPIPDILAANPDLPPETQQVIEKAMAKDREQRFQSAAELATAVNDLLALQRTAESAPSELEEVALPAEGTLVGAPNEGSVSLQAEPERLAAEEAIVPLEAQVGRAIPEVVDDGPQPVLETDVKTPAPEEAATGRSLPIWIWGLAALAVLLIVGLGIRFILQGGVAEEAPTEPLAKVTAAEVVPEEPAAEAPASEEITGEGEITTDADLPPLEAALGDTWVRETDGMTMVYVPEGTFPMGSDDGDEDEKPVHDVALESFWIDQTEVTNGYYTLCVDAEICEPSTYASDSRTNADDQPVVGVSWENAERYCHWVGGRLPSEAEWEYAARGPDGLTYPWGDSFYSEVANFCDSNCWDEWADLEVNDGYNFSAGVNQYTDGKSWVGALNMAGNVWEMVNDWYGSDYYAKAPPNNPQGPEEGAFKVLRGGSWNSSADDLRSSNRTFRLRRSALGMSYGIGQIGFRCAVSPGS